MSEKVSAAEAKAQLSTLVSRVAYGRERFLIERHGKPVAALVSAEDLAKLEHEPAEPREVRRGLLAIHDAIGGLLTDEEVDEMLAAIYEARDRDTPRAVILPDDL